MPTRKFRRLKILALQNQVFSESCDPATTKPKNQWVEVRRWTWFLETFPKLSHGRGVMSRGQRSECMQWCA